MAKLPSVERGRGAVSGARRLSRRAVLAGAAGAGLLGASRQGFAAGFPRLADLRITMLVGSDAGGGYDLCGRALARHLERTAPGLRVDVKNIPQASGKLAAKMLQEGPTDGSMLFTSTPGLLSSQVLGEDGVAFDLVQWSWIGKVAEESRFLVSGPGADFANLEELRAKSEPSPLSVRSTTSYVYHETLWLNSLLGTRINPVPGYKAVEKDLAVVNGEVMLTLVTYPNDRKVLELPEINVILRNNEGDAPERFKDRPILSAVLGDRPELQPLLRFMTASSNLLRWFAAPPNTDSNVLAELRSAFDLTVASPEFVADAEKLDFKVNPMSGVAVADLIGSVLAERDSLSARMAASLECGKALAEGLDGSCAST